jgi:hypothetical protein
MLLTKVRTLKFIVSSIIGVIRGQKGQNQSRKRLDTSEYVVHDIEETRNEP